MKPLPLQVTMPFVPQKLLPDLGQTQAVTGPILVEVLPVEWLALRVVMDRNYLVRLYYQVSSLSMLSPICRE
jgi:hypothetical protein